MAKFGRTCVILPFALAVIPLSLACSLLSRFPVFTDGCYLGTAKTWSDTNANGIWEINGKPLPGVIFELKDGQSDTDYLYEPVSGENGEFFISIFPNTCESLAGYDLILRATPPPGYRAATPGELPIPLEGVSDLQMKEYLFGFRKI